jgi:hypothetical protein
MNRLILAAIAVLLVGCSAASPPRLQQAAASCGATEKVQDKGTSISFDTQGKSESAGDPATAVTCVLKAMSAPSYVLEHILSTRALDGSQTDEWDGYQARWTYHPDAGLRLTLVDRR